MANFHTHITTSTVLGVGYAGAGWLYGLPLPSCVLAGGMCSLAGMLPDLDSGTGRPLRESTAFLAAVTPLLMIDRFQHMGLTPESMVLAGGLIYLLIRFGVHTLLKKYTVHRGMFHSLPAVIIVGQLGFLVCGCHDLNMRLYKAGSVMLGYLSHLLLDEMYSIDWKRGRPRLKKSFGTALKMSSGSLWGNVSTYSKLAFFAFVIIEDPMFREQWERLSQYDGLPLTNSAADADLHHHADPLRTPAQPRHDREPPEELVRLPGQNLDSQRTTTGRH